MEHRNAEAKCLGRAGLGSVLCRSERLLDKQMEIISMFEPLPREAGEIRLHLATGRHASEGGPALARQARVFMTTPLAVLAGGSAAVHQNPVAWARTHRGSWRGCSVDHVPPCSTSRTAPRARATLWATPAPRYSIRSFAVLAVAPPTSVPRARRQAAPSPTPHPGGACDSRRLPPSSAAGNTCPLAIRLRICGSTSARRTPKRAPHTRVDRCHLT